MATSSPQKAVIQRIRRERFLLDVEIPEEMAAGLTSMREDLDQALTLLSKDLYSTKTHFALELVQNADDNRYAKGTNPSLHFNLASDVLVVSNNETGFEESNVEALCRTGKSSKAQKAGYIGEKGIGFKSIFIVSDAPEIHSNGFHFRFDRTASGTLLGYVVPHWYEPTRALDDSLTNIVIPAKAGATFAPDVLADLEARLLLFLSRLKSLSLNSPSGRVAFTRIDQGVLTKLSTTAAEEGQDEVSSTEYFVRVEHNISMADLVEEKRPDIKQSQVVLALPVSSDSKARPDAESLAYAFLPVRPFGLKFAIQADFLLISSRGDIHTDLAWNIRLRDSIAPAFVSGLPSYKRRQGLSHTFLSFLPSDEDRVDPFFKSVVSNLREMLAQTECILSEGGPWIKPSGILVPLPKFRELFASQDVRKLFGMDYVKPGFEAPTDTLTKLGCKSLTYEHVFSVFKEHAGWFNRKSREWRAKFYGFLASLNWEGLEKNGLLKIPCVPVANDGYVVPEQKSVFLPLSHDRTYGFEHELSIIDKKLYDKAVEFSPDVAQLFARLNVLQADSYQLITGHILPKHEDDSWLESDNTAIVGHIRYIKENLEAYLRGAKQAGRKEDNALNDLANALQIGTKDQSDGWIFNQADDLYLSREFEPQFVIESLLGSAINAGHLVSPEYLKTQTESPDAQVSTDVAGWRDFFLKLGVREEPRLLKQADGDYLCSAEMTALLEHRSASVRKAALECIDRRWHKYSNALTYDRKESRNHYTPTDTVFVRALRNCIAPTRKTAKVTLPESFLDTPELRDLFGETAVYLEADLKQPGLIKACKITDRADAQACLKRLRQLKASETDTTPILRRLYGQLHHLWEKEGPAIKAVFDSEPLIRIRGERSAWLTPSQACWRSTSRLAELVYVPLAGVYGDLEVFFGKLGVAKKLSLPRLVAALPRLVEFSSLEERMKEAMIVYRDCSRELNLRPSQDILEQPRWLTPLLKSPAYLTVDGRVVANTDALYLDDSPEFGSLFHDQPGINVFAVSRSDQPKIAKLLELLQLQRLSDYIEIELVDDDDGVLNEKFTHRLEAAFVPIARVISHFDHDGFERAVVSGAFNTLMNSEVREVDELRLAVTLDDVTKGASGETCLSKGRIVFRSGIKSVPDKISVEVCRLLGVGRTHSDAITRLLIATDSLEMEEYLQVKDIPTLSTEDEDALLSVGSVGEGVDQEGNAPSASEQGSTAEDEVDGTQARGGDEATPAPPVPTRQPLEPGSPTSPAATPDASNSAAGQPQGSGTTQSADGRPTPAPSSPSHSPPPSATSAPSQPGSDNVNRPLGAEGQHPTPPPATERTAGSWHGLPAGTSNGANAPPRNQAPSAAGLAPTNGAPSPAPKPSAGGTPATGGGNAKPSGAPIVNIRRGRLLSYAEASGESTDDHESNPDKIAARDAIAAAAVQAFMSTKNSRWKRLAEMPPNNPGFDVAAVAHDDGDEFIEVKGQSGAWTEEGVALTPTELTHAHQARSRYWLCVVEYALDPDRRVVHLVNDPFSRVTQFRFDSGWKSQVISDEPPKPLEPDAGMRIEIANVGSGVIVSVRPKGPFYKLQVTLDDGRAYDRTFDPGTMRLLPTEGAS